jgi:hypothetical protein
MINNTLYESVSVRSYDRPLQPTVYGMGQYRLHCFHACGSVLLRHDTYQPISWEHPASVWEPTAKYEIYFNTRLYQLFNTFPATYMKAIRN